jgi:hypothetical protein
VLVSDKTAPVDKPAATEKPIDKPAAAEQPADKPVSAEKPADKPTATEKPAERPAAADKPVDKAAAVAAPAEKKPEASSTTGAGSNTAEAKPAPAAPLGTPKRDASPVVPPSSSSSSSSSGSVPASKPSEVSSTAPTAKDSPQKADSSSGSSSKGSESKAGLAEGITDSAPNTKTLPPSSSSSSSGSVKQSPKQVQEERHVLGGHDSESDDQKQMYAGHITGTRPGAQPPSIRQVSAGGHDSESDEAKELFAGHIAADRPSSKAPSTRQVGIGGHDSESDESKEVFAGHIAAQSDSTPSSQGDTSSATNMDPVFPLPSHGGHDSYSEEELFGRPTPGPSKAQGAQGAGKQTSSSQEEEPHFIKKAKHDKVGEELASLSTQSSLLLYNTYVAAFLDQEHCRT